MSITPIVFDLGNVKHGYSCRGKRHELYTTWHNIMQRCYNLSNPACANYGKRGIEVYDSWHDFSEFVTYIEANLTKSHPSDTIDRKDNDGNYEPDNVKWSTPVQQARNTRTNRIVEIDGVSKCAVEWAEEYDIPYWTFHSRLRRGISGSKLLAKVRPLNRAKK